MGSKSKTHVRPLVALESDATTELISIAGSELRLGGIFTEMKEGKEYLKEYGSWDNYLKNRWSTIVTVNRVKRLMRVFAFHKKHAARLGKLILTAEGVEQLERIPDLRLARALDKLVRIKQEDLTVDIIEKIVDEVLGVEPEDEDENEGEASSIYEETEKTLREESEYYNNPENFRLNVRKILESLADQWKESLGEKEFKHILMIEVMES